MNADLNFAMNCVTGWWLPRYRSHECWSGLCKFFHLSCQVWSSRGL